MSPNFGKEQSTRNLIISILSNEWPLTAKQIHSRLSRKHGKNTSYQAAHKLIKELESGKILSRVKDGYKLSEDWIEEQSEFFNEMKVKYAGKESAFFGSKNLVFNSLLELDKFLLDFFVKFAGKPAGKKKPVLCLWWNHLWLPLFLSKKEYAQIKLLGEISKPYSLSKGNAFLDKYCAEFWTKNKLKSKTGVEGGFADLLVFNDVIIEVFYPPEILKKLDNFYNKTKSISDLVVDELFEEIFEKKVKIPVTINKNSVLAEQLRKRFLSYFK